MNRSDLPNTARVRDYWLGGSHHGPADRELAERFMVCAPHLPYLVRTQRAFLRRVIQYLVDEGVRQFLDLGSGLPTMGNVHQIAQRLAPDCRVVYVDADPVVAAESRQLTRGVTDTAYLCADLTRPHEVLADPELRELLDPAEPTAVLLVDVLHCVPDSQGPAEALSAYLSAFPSGSHLAMSHICRDPGLLAAVQLFNRLFGAPLPEFAFRYPIDVVNLLHGLDIIEPGVVPLPYWRPNQPPQQDQNPQNFETCAAVGRKP